MIDHFYTTGALGTLFESGTPIGGAEGERTLRVSLFQIMSLMTTTGFGTQDIGSSFFGAASKQLFLVMMVIGGCVGSTAGGFKVLRVAMLNRLVWGELFKAKVPSRASTDLVIDKKIVPSGEIHRVAALLFGWIALLVVGGVITAMFSDHGPMESISGMFSALGNIGPCYLSVQEMIDLHPVVKITYIVGMLAGRLELLPVLLLLSPRAWR
jgi:trk system potassium uptake protein TrkH